MHNHPCSHLWKENVKLSTSDMKKHFLPFLTLSWTWDVTRIRKLNNNWQVNKVAYIVIIIIESLNSIW